MNTVQQIDRKAQKNSSLVFRITVANVVVNVIVCTAVLLAVLFSNRNVPVEITTEIVMVAISAVAVFFTAKKILSPILTVKDRILAMAVECDFTSEVPEVFQNNEVGELFDAVHLLQKEHLAHTRDISRVLQCISENNLAVETGVEYRGDYGTQKAAIDHIIQKLNASIRQISLGAAGIAAAATSVSNGVQELSQGTTQQVSAVEQLTQSVENFRGVLKQNAADAEHATSLAMMAGKELDNGNREMQEMVRSMESISEASRQIAQVVKTVDDIAFQTNILALNAAVEAARAGAAGKGFAVVADEVRNLANKSAEASKGTADLIQKTLQSIDTGISVAHNTAEVLDGVMNSAKEATELMAKIAEATHEEEHGMDMVNGLIEQISSAAQTNSAVAQEGAASGEELNAQAQMLAQMVRLYRLKPQDDRLCIAQ